MCRYCNKNALRKANRSIDQVGKLPAVNLTSQDFGAEQIPRHSSALNILLWDLVGEYPVGGSFLLGFVAGTKGHPHLHCCTHIPKGDEETTENRKWQTPSQLPSSEVSAV